MLRQQVQRSNGFTVIHCGGFEASLELIANNRNFIPLDAGVVRFDPSNTSERAFLQQFSVLVLRDTSHGSTTGFSTRDWYKILQALATRQRQGQRSAAAFFCCNPRLRPWADANVRVNDFFVRIKQNIPNIKNCECERFKRMTYMVLMII